MVRTAKRTYRRARAIIDYANIALLAIMVLCFILSILNIPRSMFFFPVIFLLGSVMNFLSAIRAYLEERVSITIITGSIGIVIFAIAIISVFVYWI